MASSLAELYFTLSYRDSYKHEAIGAVSRPEVGGENYADINKNILVAITDPNQNMSGSRKVSIYTVHEIYDKKKKNPAK